MPVRAEQFRALFGSFPTALSVVTAVDSTGVPRGFTSNGVCAVSADPAILLISVGADSRTLPAILSSEAFVVNFLSDDGEQVSRLFASKEPDKFSSVAWRPSEIAAGAPLLTDVALGHAECCVEGAHRVGDNWLVIGRVEGADVLPGRALMYQQGRYEAWQPASVVG